MSKCPDCGEEEHALWWDCEKLPRVFHEVLNSQPRRTHGVIFKGEGWTRSDDYTRDRGQDGE